jgi:peptide/nickel transport system ATP-binding protein/oligopeptide transport system ATP-binding protein
VSEPGDTIAVPSPAVEAGEAPGTRRPGVQLLEVRDLSVRIPTKRGVVQAVDGVSFDVHAGEVVGLVGESGSGKSVTCRAVMGLMKVPPTELGGSVRLYPGTDGAGAETARELIGLRRRDRRRLWGAELSMVFQDPMTALNPVMRVGQQIMEAVAAQEALPRDAREARAVELLEQVGIPSARRRMHDYPHQFSGGMMQRALIAIALAGRPRLLFADEPTTSLDVVIQDQILELLLELQSELSMSVVLVSHDLAVVSEVCDRVMVMYAGQIVEQAPTEELLSAPRHPYTIALLRSIPQSSEGERFLRSIGGSPPDMMRLGAGCRFAPRCELAEDACRSWKTELLDVSGGSGRHLGRCRRMEETR